MVIALEGRRQWIFLVAVILLAAAYVVLAGLQFAASWSASQPELRALQRAIRLAPGNAEYRDRVGRYYFYAVANPDIALDHFQTAVRLNSHNAHYWFDLAATRQVLGDSAGQGEALEHALQAEPTDPQVAWEAANFFLVAGDSERALHEFRVVLENATELSGPALQSCWRVRPDADALLRDIIPPNPDALFSFLTLLMTKHETEATLKVWERLAQVNQKFEPRFLFDYVHYLILAYRPDAALAAWNQAAPVLDLTPYMAGPSNLVVNGDFGLDILNGGLDWNYERQPGVQLLIDPADFHQGSRSLSITFEGPGIADAGIRQFIPVHAEMTYDFNAYYKSSAFQGAGGPQIVLRDAYTGKTLFNSEPLNDADFWKPVHAQITTPPATTLLLLEIARIPAGSPIRGKLWLDNFQLAPASQKERP